ncbi:MAG: helix-turn-helix domain-containing protein [Clostridiales bacterium]|nr:helix-turn-helix domain-containing protein [Clostridiales bacterium]
MVSNRLLQECLEDFTNIMRLPMALYDRNCTCVAGEEETEPSEDIFETFCDSPADMQALGNRYLFKVGDGEMGYILSVSSSSKDTYPMGQLAVRQLERILEMGYGREDRSQFIHNLLLDNLLPIDIVNYTRQMHISPDCRWAVLFVEAAGCEAYDIQMILKGIFANRTEDFVTPMEEHGVVVVHRLEEREGEIQVQELAHVLADTVSAETLCRVRTACGTIARSLREVSRSYKEAKMALEVAEIFYASKTVITYEELGIGRLIYQLPTPLCQMFLKEVFGEFDPETLDEETLTTVYQFMENSLNLSETSRQLFVHRNTLVYRLEKLQKTLGLDIRRFEDAMTFKVAMMVADYMKFLKERQR